MSRKEQTGGPAFPVAHWDNERMRYVDDGMTLRDYFAAKALPVAMDYGRMTTESWPGFAVIAASAYALADAMLKARQQ